ncbi:hypothetical protein ACFX15_042829 [Malus domestica]
MGFPYILSKLSGPLGLPLNGEGSSALKVQCYMLDSDLAHHFKTASSYSKCDILRRANAVEGFVVHRVEKGTRMACLNPSYLPQK